MHNRKRPDALWFYAAGVILTLVIRVIDHKTAYYAVSTLCFCAELLLEAGMLLVWLNSVRRRLLPSHARFCIVACALLFLFFLAVSAVNYRIAEETDYLFKRCCWYLYYVPLLFTPSLFLLTCIDIAPGSVPLRRWRVVFLCLSAALCALVLTNDLHYLVFRPLDPDFFVTYGGYVYGVLYYVGLAFLVSAVLFGSVRLAVLFRKRRRLPAVLLPLLLMGCYIPVSAALRNLTPVRVITMPQFCIFCMVCFFELCIRMRLIPHNENYAAFFENMRFPAVITNASLSPVYSTAEPVKAGRAQLRQALEAPVYVAADERLSGRALKAGFVFYTEDESELHRMNERLSDANETLLSEHTLIKAENDLKEQRAALESRGSIYARISEKTQTRQREVARLLENADPASPGFPDAVARVTLLNAYIKRSANLLLINPQQKTVDAGELTLALEESARCLTYLGVKMEVADAPSAPLAREDAFDLYEGFETILEASLRGMRRMYAALLPEGLRLITDAPVPAPLPRTALPVAVRESEGLVYYTVRLQRGCGE